MKAIYASLFPAYANNRIRGSRLPFYFLLLTAIIWTLPGRDLALPLVNPLDVEHPAA